MDSAKKEGAELVRKPSFLQIKYSDLSLKECCGAGSFGTVYRGDWISQNKCVAVKVVCHLDAEVSILSPLNHPNIIKFYGACCEAPNFCIVSEYAPYGSLHSFLSSNSGEEMMFTQMLTWAKDIAEGMKYLHEDASMQVVHRDLKSKNILIGDANCLKICDFGSSRVFDETVVMTFAGTYPWMAPELIQGLPTSTLCDVYSFGIVLWEILTKEVPFKGLQGFQVAWVVVENHERPIIPSSCPQHLSNLIQQCWQGEPSFRPSFKEILAKLDSIMTDGVLERETNNFTQSKSNWIEEMASQMKVMKNNESKIWAEDEAARKRNAIIKRWTENLGEELKKHSICKYSFKSFHRSVSITDESQVTINNESSSTAGKERASTVNDGKIESSSVASRQEYHANASCVSKEDFSLGVNLRDESGISSHLGTRRNSKMKKQLSLGSLENRETRRANLRRLTSAPYGALMDSGIATEPVTLKISPEIIAKALRSSEILDDNVLIVAHKLFKNIKQLCDVDASRTPGDSSKNLAKSPLLVNAECQTDAKACNDVSTQCQDNILTDSGGRSNLSSPLQRFSNRGEEFEFTREGNRTKNTIHDSEFEICSEKCSALQVGWARRNTNTRTASHEKAVSASWKRKGQDFSLLNSSLRDKFL